mgnify:CR=1
MFNLDNKDIDFFRDNGYLTKVVLEDNQHFNIFSNKFKKELDQIPLTELKKLGGYNAGNLNIDPGIIGNQLYKIIKDIKFEEFFYKIVGEKIDNYQITTGGNLNLPDSSFQDFHTDGFWAPRMFILNIATSKIDLNNGPMEVYEKSHQSFLPYWKFFFKKFSMKKKKILLNFGEILFREHRLWHRGTKNTTKKNRELLGIMFIRTDKNLIKDNQPISSNEKILIYANMFDETFKGKLKEFIYIYTKFIFQIYKMILSIIRNI